MAFTLGMNAELKYKAGGVGGVGDFALAENVRDLRLPMTQAEADVTTRGNNGWRAMVGTLKEGEVTWDMVYDQDDTAMGAFQTAFMTNAVIGLQVLDDDDYGLEADFMITGFELDQSLEEAVMVSVTAKITRSETAPVFGDRS